jgi:hypothetical protein
MGGRRHLCQRDPGWNNRFPPFEARRADRLSQDRFVRGPSGPGSRRSWDARSRDRIAPENTGSPEYEMTSRSRNIRANRGVLECDQRVRVKDRTVVVAGWRRRSTAWSVPVREWPFPHHRDQRSGRLASATDACRSAGQGAEWAVTPEAWGARSHRSTYETQTPTHDAAHRSRPPTWWSAPCPAAGPSALPPGLLLTRAPRSMALDRQTRRAPGSSRVHRRTCG